MESPNETPPSWFAGLGGTLFWGVLSIFFATTSCYYFWKNQENSRTARLVLDQQSLLQQQNASLKSDVEKLQARLQASELKLREDILNPPAAPEPPPQPADPSNPAARPVLEAMTKLATELSPTAEIKTRLEKDDVIVVLPNALIFVPGSPTEIRSGGKTLLLKFLKAGEEVATTWDLLVESHTDSDAMKGYASNWELSTTRATTVVKLLTGEGKWPVKQIRAVGAADTHPVAPNDTKENKALNRRIELRFVLPKG